jgi:uncharacterized protein (TIGR03435 family)
MEMPVYKLVVAESGLKMQESDADQQSLHVKSGSATGNGATLAMLANSLAAVTGKPVLDRTELLGSAYDFELSWKEAANVPEALEKQLGLHLELTRAPVDLFVVDRLDRPTEK